MKDIDAEFEREGLEDLERGTPKAKRKSNGDGNAEAAEYQGALSVENFYAYMPMHNYIFAPTRETWPASGVNARIPAVKGEDGKIIPASAWIDKNRPVQQLSWIPGEPMLIYDRLIADGGWLEHKSSGCGRRCQLGSYEPLPLAAARTPSGGFITQHNFVMKTIATDLLTETASSGHSTDHPPWIRRWLGRVRLPLAEWGSLRPCASRDRVLFQSFQIGGDGGS